MTNKRKIIRKKANALDRLCRFGGNTTRFYSVLEHTLIGCEVLMHCGASRRTLQGFFLHDMHETMTGDLTYPTRRHLGEGFDNFVREIDRENADTLGVSVEVIDSVEVEEMDALMAHVEINNVVIKSQILGGGAGSGSRSELYKSLDDHPGYRLATRLVVDCDYERHTVSKFMTLAGALFDGF